LKRCSEQAATRYGVPGLLALIAAALLAGCAASPAVISDKPDPVTGVTVTYSKTPLIMYRDNPAQAAYARNFLHLGPVEVNDGGSHQYYLWLGIWNTMRSADQSEHREGFDSIVLFADGEPMALEVSGWTPAAIGASEHTYVRPVANASDAYYRVTADQIRLLAEAVDIRLRTTGPAAREFHLWNEQRAAKGDLAEFLVHTLH